MVFVVPLEFYAPDRKELPVAQLDFGPWPIVTPRVSKPHDYANHMFIRL
jgi:hypothetical protein